MSYSNETEDESVKVDVENKSVKTEDKKKSVKADETVKAVKKKYQLLDSNGKDTKHCYSGTSPKACAIRAWRAIFKETEKKADVIRLREHKREGKDRRVHIYKLTGSEATKMGSDEKTPEWLRGITITTPTFDKQPVEHVNCTDAREPFLSKKPKTQKKKE